jgi:hypothetical protein
VVWQWLLSASRSRWAARTRVPAAAAIALNGLWLLAVQADLIWLSVAVMAGIVASLGLVLSRTTDLAREGWAADLPVSATFGLYLGWIAVATCANSRSSSSTSVSRRPHHSEGVTVAVLVVVVGIVAWLPGRVGHRLLAVIGRQRPSAPSRRSRRQWCGGWPGSLPAASPVSWSPRPSGMPPPPPSRSRSWPCGP